jgi:hypothetical protein
MRALVLNCTLKASPEASNTEALARVVMETLEGDGIQTEVVRVVDHDVRPGVSSDEGDGDAWPAIYDKILGAEILIIAVPLARPALEHRPARARASRRDVRAGRPGRPGCLQPAGRSGAHRQRGRRPPRDSETTGALIDGPGPSYLEASEGHEWSHSTGRAMASNLAAAARALAAKPIPAPPS